MGDPRPGRPRDHVARPQLVILALRPALGGDRGRPQLERAAAFEDHELRAGHVFARPPGTRIAHSVVPGDEGITYLVYGTREPNDIAYYPRSNKVYFRGVGLMTRLESLDYGDGEPDDF